MIESSLPSNKSFGYFFALVFFIISFFIKFLFIKYALLFLSLTLVFTTILKPSLLNSLNNLWFRFGIILNKIFSPIILILIYCLTIAPVSFLFTIFKSKKKIDTTWVISTDNIKNLEKNYKDQF